MHKTIKPIKPKPGQVWSFRGGRQCTVKEVSRGAVGAWKVIDGRMIPINRATAMWVKWTEPYCTITVRALWQNFTFVR